MPGKNLAIQRVHVRVRGGGGRGLRPWQRGQHSSLGSPRSRPTCPAAGPSQLLSYIIMASEPPPRPTPSPPPSLQQQNGWRGVHGRAHHHQVLCRFGLSIIESPSAVPTALHV